MRNLSSTMSTQLYVWVIDQDRGQDGWILAKFFFCVALVRRTTSH